MGKKKASTVENRVYLFRDLAAAFLAESGAGLVGSETQRDRTLRALGDIAHAACVLADRGDLGGRRVGTLVARGHGGTGAPSVSPGTAEPANKTTKKTAKNTAKKTAKKTTKKAAKKAPKKAAKKTTKTTS